MKCWDRLLSFLRIADSFHKVTRRLTGVSMIKHIVGSVFCFICMGCGIYTFSGSTLPGHLKTVDIPLFIDQSLQPGVAEEITSELNQEILDNKLLKPVSQNSDASFNGKVLSYKNHPYTYGTESIRQVNVTSYSVTISVDIEFYDNKKDKVLYKGVVTEEGIYDFETETEEDGKKRAVKKIIDQIMQNSVQSW